jgi:hypothetical protein
MTFKQGTFTVGYSTVDLLRSAALIIQNIIFYFSKQLRANLNEGVNRTKPSPSISVPCSLP